MRIVLVVLLAVLAIPASRAADASVVITAHNLGAPGSHDETPYWFEVQGEDGHNPPIRVDPGAHVTLVFTNLGDRPHSLHLGAPLDLHTDLIDANESAKLEFDVPANATGTSTYWCDAHRVIGMLGAIDFGNATGPAPVADELRKSLVPWDGWLAVAALACGALVARGRFS